MRSKQKTIALVSVLLAVLLIGGFGWIKAYGHRAPWAEGRWHRPWGGASFHARHHGPDISRFVLWQLDEHVAELGLSDEQKARYGVVREQVRGRMAELKTGRTELMENLHDLMAEENPDLEEALELARGAVRSVSGSLEGFLEDFGSLFAILDSDQKAQVAAHFKDRFRAGHVPCDPYLE